MKSFIATFRSWERKVLGTVILKYAGTMAPTAPILFVVGGAKVELAQALVPCETGAMGTEPFRSQANSLRGANRPIEPGPICSLVLLLSGCSLELLQHVYVAIYFLSSKFPGHFAPGSESSRERIGPEAKRL